MARVRVHRKGNAHAAQRSADFPLNLVMHPGTEHPQDEGFEYQYLCLFKDGYWMITVYVRDPITGEDTGWENVQKWARLPKI